MVIRHRSGGRWPDDVDEDNDGGVCSRFLAAALSPSGDDGMAPSADRATAVSSTRWRHASSSLTRDDRGLQWWRFFVRFA